MSWLDQLAEIRDRDWSDASDEDRLRKSGEVITISGYAAAAASVVPVPLSELALLLPIHTAMVMTVGHVHGRSVSRAEAARVAAELGAIAGLTFAGTAALGALRKLLLPGIGGVLAAPAAFALTWGLGQVAVAYFSDPELSQDELKKVFKDAMKEGRGLFSKERFESFRQRNGEGDSVAPEPEVEVVPDEEEQKPPAEAPSMPETEPEPEGPDDSPSPGRKRKL
ncbi:MAG: DUF697 domain-containing protein [Myxococcota bacterium]